MTDSIDDLLGAIAEASEQAASRPASPHDDPEAAAIKARANSLIASVTAGARASADAAAAQAPAEDDPVRLMALDDEAFARLLRTVSADTLVVVLTAVDDPFRRRVAELLDDESRAWLKENLRLLGQVTRHQQRDASRKLMAVAERLSRRRPDPQAGPTPHASTSAAAAALDGPRPTAVTASPGEGKGKGIAMGFGMSVGPADAAPAPSPVSDDSPSTEDATLTTITQLLRLVQQQGHGALAALRDEVDHPLLAVGIEMILNGEGGSGMTTALQGVQHQLEQQYRAELDLWREGIMALRFEESPAAFLARVRDSG